MRREGEGIPSKVFNINISVAKATLEITDVLLSLSDIRSGIRCVFATSEPLWFVCLEDRAKEFPPRLENEKSGNSVQPRI